MIVTIQRHSTKITRPSNDLYRRAALALSAACRQTGYRSAMISSAVSREGTTTAAIHICRHLRRDFGLNPLLIEANRVRPTLTRLFDLDDRKSMATILSYDGSARECVQRDPTGLAMIPAGDCSTSFLLPSLESTLCHAVEELKNSFDFILVDVPPILESPDVFLAGRIIPQLILVVAAGQASGESIDRACQELREANITIVGTILNSRKRIIPRWIERWL